MNESFSVQSLNYTNLLTDICYLSEKEIVLKFWLSSLVLISWIIDESNVLQELVEFTHENTHTITLGPVLIHILDQSTIIWSDKLAATLIKELLL